MDGEDICSRCIGAGCAYRLIYEFLCQRKFLGEDSIYVHGCILVLFHYERIADDQEKKCAGTQELDDAQLQHGNDCCDFQGVSYSFLLLWG